MSGGNEVPVRGIHVGGFEDVEVAIRGEVAALAGRSSWVGNRQVGKQRSQVACSTCHEVPRPQGNIANRLKRVPTPAKMPRRCFMVGSQFIQRFLTTLF